MSKRKAESDNKRQFNELWENEFLFIASPSGKPMCIVCESTLSDNRRHDLSRHYKKHQVEVKEKQKLMPGSELHKEYVVKKKENMKKRRNLFVKRSCESLAMLEASYEIAFVLAKKHMPFSDGEYIVKPCLQKFAKCLGDKSIERKVNEITLSKQTITRRIEELSRDVFEQLKERVHACSFFSLALDESADICDVAQLSIFIRGIDDNFNIFEELIGLESLHGKTRGSDIFEKVKSCSENQHLNFSKLLSVCTINDW
ncbi:SCAN domain-containing protein 3-like [Tachypleus tridentatus]|uniref:SCAN domain-containing protein 3-like n=1 Tax=Tachypleus tridentatus TaxID=6853 RepID=UPI003FD345DF